MSLQDRCHDHVVTLGLTTLRPLSLRFPVPLLRLVLSSFSVLVWFACIVGMHPLSYFHGIPTPLLLLHMLGPLCTAYMQLHSVSHGSSCAWWLTSHTPFVVHSSSFLFRYLFEFLHTLYVQSPRNLDL